MNANVPSQDYRLIALMTLLTVIFFIGTLYYFYSLLFNELVFSYTVKEEFDNNDIIFLGMEVLVCLILSVRTKAMYLKIYFVLLMLSFVIDFVVIKIYGLLSPGLITIYAAAELSAFFIASGILLYFVIKKGWAL